MVAICFLYHRKWLKTISRARMERIREYVVLWKCEYSIIYLQFNMREIEWNLICLQVTTLIHRNYRYFNKIDILLIQTIFLYLVHWLETSNIGQILRRFSILWHHNFTSSGGSFELKMVAQFLILVSFNQLKVHIV